MTFDIRRVANERALLVKKEIIILCALATPAHATEKCTSMCHFFDAWAITQTCKDLTFNQSGRQTDKDFGDLRDLKRQALTLAKRMPDACHPSCMGDSDDDKEGTPCQYLIERK